MRTKGSYLGHYPLVGSGGIQGIDGIYPLNQTFSLRGDLNWPTQPQVISIDLSTTSLNETDSRTLTVTVVTKGFQQSLYAWIIPVGGSSITSDDFSTPAGSNMYIGFTSSPRDTVETDVITFEVAEDETDETPDTEQFKIQIADLNGTVYGESSTITINDTSTTSPYTIYETNWSLPANQSQGSSWLSSGTVTVTNGQAGAGYWVWVMDDIDGYRSDLQLNDFVFNSDISTGSVANTNTALNPLFETTFNGVSLTVFTTAQVLSTFRDRLDNNGFTQVVTGTASGRCNTYNAAPPSSGTGISDGTNYFVYFESSGSGTDRELMLTTEKMTYTSSPTCSFSYALSASSSYTANVGRSRLFWIEDNS